MPGCCAHCQEIESQFSPDVARRDLKRYRRRGPSGTTRLLIDDLSNAGVSGNTLLDIGGGIGVIHHELLDRGAARAVHVDASQPYIDAARDEATRRGHADRVQFFYGDFVERATELEAADIVTLDRVICCYPDMNALVRAAASKTRREFGAAYPRDVWWTRAVVRAVNMLMRLRRSTFRVFVHSPAAIDAVLRAAGLERVTMRRTIPWEVVTYRRTRPTAILRS